MQRQRIILASALLILGSLLAWYVQSGGDTVRVEPMNFVGPNDTHMSALLYVPDGVDKSHKAPGILAIHGYINSKETQSGFAIEFARRGFVVLAPDQTGHGYSDPPAFAQGFGGPAALAYLRSLPFVDVHRIGLEGHSMGGWAVLMAAKSDPSGYRSMVLEGSSTGSFGTPKGTPLFPRNLLLVESRFDEFSLLMWGVKVPADVVSTQKLKTLFGTDEDVVPGKMYGSIESGSARKLEMPAVTHPGDHLSRAAIGDAVAWFQKTLENPGLPASQQIWYWKSLGTLIALLGFVVLLFPVLDWLFRSKWFADLRRPVPQLVQSGRVLLVNRVLTALIPIVTFFPLQDLANIVFPANRVFAQQITNGVLLWALGNAVIFLAFFWWRHRGTHVAIAELGMPINGKLIWKSLAVAVICCSIMYLVEWIAGKIFNIDFRFWVVALKIFSSTQAVLFLIYLLPFTLFFLVLSFCLHTQLGRNRGIAADMLLNGFILSIGFVVLLVLQYTPLLLGGSLLLDQPLLSIVAFQFVPLMFLVGLVSTFCLERTGSIYTGAFVNAILVTWYMVAGTATQVAPFWY